MRFWVRVPVLSEQMTPAQPRVSTAGSFFTIAPRLAIRPTPRASTRVTMAGRPSGMAATARETAVRNISSIFFPWRRPNPNITAHTHRHRKDSFWEISAILAWRGVVPSSWSESIPAIWPIWLSRRAPAGGDQGAGEDHVDPVTQRGVGGKDEVRVLFHRGGLAGHGALVGLKAAGGQEPGVGGDQVPGF